MKRFVMVTQTFPPAVGGMQSMMGALACALSARSTTVVYPDHPSRCARYMVRYFPMNKLIRAYFKRVRLRFSLTDDDVVICDSWKSLAAVPRSAKCVVVMAHGQEYLVRDQEKLSRIQFLLGKATHLVASSRATLAYAQEAVDLSHIKATVIAPTYGLDPIESVAAASHAPHRKRRLLSICRLEARKGLHLVMDVLASLRDCPDFEWHIIGQGVYDQALKTHATDHGLTEKIHFLGYVDDAEKRRLLEQADVYVMPSYQEGDSLEGFGITYIEAARFGVASIAGIAGGVGDAVMDGFTGWCVDPLDKEQLTQAVCEALYDGERCAQYGFNARSYFQDTLSSSHVLDHFLRHISGEVSVHSESKT